MTDNLPPGWIPWAGGPCPVDPESRPGVMFRDGEIIEAGKYPANEWIEDVRNWWHHQGPDSPDIIAYRKDEP